MTHLSLPTHVTLVEVSPRDGLQNETQQISTEIKLSFINQLVQAGLSVIEATSFVSPQWVPAMADHAKVMQKLNQLSHVKYLALVPNLHGLQNAIQSHCKHIAVMTAVSETFLKKNINTTIEESIDHIQQIIPIAKQNHLTIRAYISCTLGCPYEGKIHPEKTVMIAKQLMEIGCDEIVLSDTIGVGTPLQVQNLIDAVVRVISIKKCAVHFHDTYGQALANIYACLQMGVSTIDCSVGGLGGCPYAKGASGNVATEDVLYMLNGLGIQTGVDLNAVICASEFIHKYLSHKTRSKVGMAWKAQNELS